jgi:hypothetical protein
MTMKKSNVILGLVLILAGLTTTLFAATVEEIAGTWDVSYTATFRVSRLGADADITLGTCTFDGGGNLEAYEEDNGTDRIYKGTFQLDSRGRRIIAHLSPEDFKDMLRDWLVSMGNEEGVSIAGVSFNVTSFIVSPSVISPRTKIPGKVRITIRGKVSGYVDGEYKTTNFSYQCLVTFYSKQ